MTDYLELLLEPWEEEEEAVAPLSGGLKIARLNAAKGTANALAAEGNTTGTVPDEQCVVPANRTGGNSFLLYDEIRRARRALHPQRRQERWIAGDGQMSGIPQVKAVHSRMEGEEPQQQWAGLWEPTGGAPTRTRYAALVDAEFQRDARRYDGALGLL